METKIKSSSLMLVDEDDLKDFVFLAIDEVLARRTEDSASETYLTSKDVAKMLGISYCTLWRWNKSGYLCHVKCGRKSFYKKSDVESLMQGRNKGQVINDN